MQNTDRFVTRRNVEQIAKSQHAIANIHGANESVDPNEIEKMAVAQALLIQSLANR